MADPSILAMMFDQPPTEAIKALDQRKIKPSGSWFEIKDHGHNRSFGVAQMAQLDLLQDVQDSLRRALSAGLTLKDFVTDLTPRLQAAGWWGKTKDGKQLGSPHRLTTIYQTNMQASYMAGRRTELLAATDTHPNWRYEAVMDRRTRPSHAALNDRVMPANDPAWDSIFPPNGYRCRCRVSPVSASEEGVNVQSSRGKLSTETVTVGRNGETADVSVLQLDGMSKPFRVDAGFNAAPGQQITQQFLNKAAIADPVAAANIIRNLTKDPQALDQLTKDFKAFADPILTQVPLPGQPSTRLRLNGSFMHIGAIPVDVIQALAAMGKPLKSAVISVRDEDVVHANRPDKHKHVSRSWYLDMPKHVIAPQAVLADNSKGDGSLLFIYPMAGNSRTKIVVKTDVQVTTKINGKKEKIETNVVRTVQEVNVTDLTSSLYVLLTGVI